MSQGCIAIVDDDDAVRISTSRLVARTGFATVEFADGPLFLEREPESPLACVLLDVRMPGMDGLEVLKTMRARGDRTPVVMITGHGDVALAVDAMKAGATDFVEKPYPAALLLAAVDAAIAAPRPDHPPATDSAAAERIAALPPRQRDVLRGLLAGQPNKIIAWRLGISARTVEHYRATVMRRLGVRSLSEAVRLALAAGLEPASGDTRPGAV